MRRSAAALAVGLIMTVLAAWGWLGQAPAPTVAGPAVVARMSDFPVDATGGGRRFAISADGSMIAARRQGNPSERLHLRRSDELEFREIPGSEGALGPTFSPDGTWLAFEQDGFIRRVETAGGPVLPVTEGEDPHWGAPDVIVFQRDRRLYSVAPTGGEPSPLISDESLTAIRPALLPGGMAVVFEAVGAGDAFGGPSSSIMLLDLATGEVTDLGLRGSSPTYVGTGHLVFGVPEQALMAVPFDLRRLEVTGEVFTVLPDVHVSATGSLRFAVSDNGIALYALSLLGSRGTSEVVEVTLDGNLTPTRLTAGAYRHPRYSPDGRHIALERTGEVWIYDRETGETERFSDGPGFYPVWSRDGRYVYYVVAEFPGSDIVRRRSDGTGEVEVAHSPDLDVYRYPTSASRQSDDFALGEYRPSNARREPMNIAVMGVGADGVEVRSYLQAEYNELMPAISPDGRWVAYLSTEDPSRTLLFVRGFDDATGQIPIPSGVNGVGPVWAPDGTALYHGVNSGRGTPITGVMRVPLLPGTTFSIGPAEILFEGAYASGDAAFAGTNWDVHPDGQRFVMITAGEGATPSATAGLDMRLVVNWFEELRAVEGR